MCLLITKVSFLQTYTGSTIRCTKSTFVAGDKCLEMHVAMTNLPYPFPDIIHVLGKMCCRKGSKRREKSSALWGITCRATISLQKNKQLTISFLVSYILFISSASPPPHLTFPLFPPPYLFYKRKNPQHCCTPFSFIYICMYMYSSALKRFVCFILLSISSFNFTSTKYTFYATSLHITALSFMSLVYFGSFSVVPNFSIHSLSMLFLS